MFGYQAYVQAIGCLMARLLDQGSKIDGLGQCDGQDWLVLDVAAAVRHEGDGHVDVALAQGACHLPSAGPSADDHDAQFVAAAMRGAASGPVCTTLACGM